MSTEEIPSVLDHEAFAAKYMPDLGREIKEFQVFHWKISGWKGFEKKLTSSGFDCGGYKWRIVLYPRGNFNPPRNVVSAFLDCTGSKEKEWHAYAQFALAISNPHDPSVHIVRCTHHRFTANRHDLGYHQFSELRTLTQPQPDRNRPTIEEDSAVVSVYVRVLGDFVFINPNYIGLKNQGTAAYMNAELQSLFYIHYFRKAVYQIPVEKVCPTGSIPLALQRVFYDLQTSDQPVDTSVLAECFGWNSIDSFMAQDVQEFNKVFIDKIESLMKGTPAEGAIPKLFRGKVKNFIRCVNVNYEECRVEEFDGIRLEVKGMKTLYDSFRNYVTVEMLDGKNKYDVEGFGLQDAQKGTIFLSFPPVLHLRLKRFNYDTQLDGMVKINDRFEFPSEINLNEFLDKTADRSKPWKYELHSVLVHSGDLHYGHNYAMIKPGRSTQWFKSGDGRVAPVTDQEVLEENYGGGPGGSRRELRWRARRLWKRTTVESQKNPEKNHGGGLGVSHQAEHKTSTNAYALTYIRQEAITEVMTPLDEKDTPLHLKRRFN